MPLNSCRIVVVGGGIAGVSCVDELVNAGDLPEHTNVVFVCGKNGYIKRVKDYEKVGIVMERFDVESEPVASFSKDYPTVELIEENVVNWDSNQKVLLLSSGRDVSYDKLVIATGARPKTLNSNNSERILTIRDTDTVKNLEKKLKDATSVGIIGDGGIGMELAYELKSHRITWFLKEVSVGTMFFSVQVAFEMESHFETGRESTDTKNEVKYQKFASSDHATHEVHEEVLGCSLGPFWLGKLNQPQTPGRHLDIRRDARVVRYHIRGHEVEVELSNGELITVDLVVEAMGVWPNSDIWKRNCDKLCIADDGGIVVDEHMMTSIKDVYACGDVCTVQWKRRSHLWRQMRLWTQARQFGRFTARCIIDDTTELDPIFEMFAHTTTFAGQKVVLLGDFDSDDGGVEVDHVNDTIVRIVIRNHKVVGACLIGDSDCAEMFEQLILTELDVSHCPRPLSNQYGDIVDYFD